MAPSDATQMELSVDAQEADPMFPSHSLLKTESAFQAAAAAGGGQFHPVSLAFIDINYTLHGRGGAPEKKIIENASGYVKAGTFVAIMGPSGSGKTSLLNILAGRVERSKAVLTGQVLVNGQERGQSFRRISAYVMQDDVLFSTLTVFETLMVAGELRLPGAIPRERKLELVESIIMELGLAKARDTPIGGALTRGISGGERKRTNIAVEMLSNPSIIFLDEPTSGLDSFQALNVMSTMADLSRSGRTIISTIHQPRSSIYALFENLLLLSEGRLIYFGRADDATSYFASRDFTCPPQFNPADYFMDIISQDRRDEKRESASAARIEALALSYQPSAEVQPGLHMKSILGQASTNDFVKLHGKYASPWYTQLRVLMKRSWLQATREKLPLIIAYVQSIVMMVVISVLYSEISNTQKSIQDRQGVIFFVAIFFAFNGVFQMITTFPAERAIVNRERAANSYRIFAYYPAKVLSEWVLRAGPTVFFVVIAYWPVKFQRDVGKFFLFCLVAVLEFTAMNAVGLMVSSIAPTAQVALALGPLCTVVFMLFGGFYVNLNNIPVWIRWFSNCSPIKWGFVGLAVTEFRGTTYTCTSEDVTCLTTGEQVLNRLSINGYTIEEALGYQCIVIVAIHCLAQYFLWANGPKLQPISKLGGSATVGGAKGAVTNGEGAEEVDIENGH
eukprot:TRINITY_DN29600_c0_g1_i1.p1 TRINITY_DN29600_c0_g1~~TRINITY_DN29600_c0_g1_i1.p1  ORF type:complete len:676 (+),score=133.03 TRINITY_DN29600_c0_g1_i1:262-2289(+)